MGAVDAGPSEVEQLLERSTEGIELEPDVHSLEELPRFVEHMYGEQWDYQPTTNDIDGGQNRTGWQYGPFRVNSDVELEAVGDAVEHYLDDTGYETWSDLVGDVWEQNRSDLYLLVGGVVGTALTAGSAFYSDMDEATLLTLEIVVSSATLGMAGLGFESLHDKYGPKDVPGGLKQVVKNPMTPPQSSYVEDTREEAMSNYYIVDADHRRIQDHGDMGAVLRNRSPEEIEQYNELITVRESERDDSGKYIYIVWDPTEEKNDLQAVLDNAFIDRDFDTYEEMFDEGRAYSRNGCPDALLSSLPA